MAPKVNLAGRPCYTVLNGYMISEMEQKGEGMH
jgi:hypothetical protein